MDALAVADDERIDIVARIERAAIDRADLEKDGSQS
jgi:hypothetical protein